MTIRRVERRDTEAVVALVHELADYERAAPQCHLTPELLVVALFAETPAVFAHVAEADGEVVGVALWFLTYSTWEGAHGIYLEDLYVRPDHRGAGHGRTLLAELAALCLARKYTRLQWAVLDWNTPAIGFYRSLGAGPLDEWVGYRLDGPALAALAASATASSS